MSTDISSTTNVPYCRWRIDKMATNKNTLRQTLDAFLSIKNSNGIIYIYLNPSTFYSMTYSEGTITYKSHDDVDRLMDSIVERTESSGEGYKINHHIYILEGENDNEIL